MDQGIDKGIVWHPTEPTLTRLWAFMDSIGADEGAEIREPSEALFAANKEALIQLEETASQTINHEHSSQTCNNDASHHRSLTQTSLAILKENKDPVLRYEALYRWSLEDPAAFWASICRYFNVTFDNPPKRLLTQHEDMAEAQWFSGATFNFAQKLLSRRDNHTALISITEKGERQHLSYASLFKQVSACAAGLQSVGVQAGDRIAAVMPNIPSTVIAMLATTSLGAIWSSCSPDFGVQALVDRFGQINPKILFITDGHQYLGKVHAANEKLKSLHAAIPSLEKIVVVPNIGLPLDLSLISIAVDWQNFLQPVRTCRFKSLPFDHPVYILFSSGTTGKPKCLVHGAGGTLLQHLKELGLHTNIHPHDNLFFYTTCGWMMWHWMVSGLALGCTITLYDGAPMYPNYARLFELIEEEKVSVFGTSAKFISSVEKAGFIPRDHFPLSNLRTILSTGSPLLPQHYDFVYNSVQPNVQLSSISGGTDIISCFALGNPLLPVYRGELQCRGLGMAVNIFNEAGQPILEARGELVCTQPFPSMPVYFWGDPTRQRYKKTYFSRFAGVWCQGDFAEITAHRGLIIYGRSDTTLNAGGIRIGTAEIYRQIESIPEILDSVVIEQTWQDDTRIVLFVQLKQGLSLDDALVDRIRYTLRHQASPRHVPAKILEVTDIPRTINGKVVEMAVRQIVQGERVENLGSLANPDALAYFSARKELQ